MPHIKLPKNKILKVLVILFSVSLTFYFLPFVIGGLFFYLVYKKIAAGKLRYSLLFIILISTLLIGSSWVAGMSTGPAIKKDIKGTQVSNSPTLIPTPIPTVTIISTEIPTSNPTTTSTPIPKPTAKQVYVQPTTAYIFKTPVPTQIVQPTTIPANSSFTVPTQEPIQTVQPTTVVSNNSGSFTCDCTKTCPEISSCEEAQYLLNTCGCRQRDADHDGIACDSAPLHCQN